MVEVLVFLILFGYFLNTVIYSVLKWNAKKLGVSQKMNTSPFIQYPAIAICPCNTQIAKIGSNLIIIFQFPVTHSLYFKARDT